MLFTCTPWRAAVLAAPHLVPAAELELPGAAAGPRALELALDTAASLNPLTWKVVISSDFDEAQVGTEPRMRSYCLPALLANSLPVRPTPMPVACSPWH